MTGAILAIEGLIDGAAVLNGPTGCKFYHASVSDTQLPREGSLDPILHSDLFYFGQPRVPCTYLDDEDYIYGSENKVRSVLPRMLEKGYRLIGVINSPGASLIGDEIPRIVEDSGIGVRHVSLESTGFTGRLVDGFQKGTVALLEELVEESERKVENKVNLVGVSLYQRRWGHSVDHLTHLLGACGIEVGSVICAGSTVDQIASSAEVIGNVVVHEEYSDRVVKWYQGNHDIPWFSSEAGAPVGFEALEEWIEGVGRLTRMDMTPALRMVRGQRRRAHDLVSRYNSITGLPKGCSFGIRGDASLILPITTFLYDYLGMVPEHVECNGTSDRSVSWNKLVGFLEGRGLEDCIRGSMDEKGFDVILADGNMVGSMVAMGRAGSGVVIGLPSISPMDLMRSPLLGLDGTLNLLDCVLNGLWGLQDSIF
jgi:nitrogenase molybdenum-iron protein alpha/beta subunit